MPESKRLAFAKPPIWEVSIGTMTQPMMLSEYDIRGFHNVLRAEFPGIAVVEGFPDLNPAPRPLALQPQPPAEMRFEAPPRRWWFVAEDEHLLVQAQPNMLALNWRRHVAGSATTTDYPGFAWLLAKFREIFGNVAAWHQSEGRLMPPPVSCNVLYDNLIRLDLDVNGSGRIGDVYHQHVASAHDPVPMFNWQTMWSEEIPALERPRQSSLTIQVSGHPAALPPDQTLVPVLKMQFDARYLATDWDTVFRFFDVAHDRIGDRLVGLTTDQARTNWEPV